MTKPPRLHIVPPPESAHESGHESGRESGRGPIASPLTNQASFLVRLAQLRSFDEFHRHFAGLGVTPAGFSVFALIVCNPGIRPGVIAEQLRIKPSNVAVLINALAASGLVERRPDQEELRAYMLHATTQGMTAWQQMARCNDAVDAAFTEGLSPAERCQLVTLLQKLLHR